MTPERWQEIKRVLEVALSLDTTERGAYLDKTCAGDADLRQEVDSLLASYQPTGQNILDAPVANILDPGPAETRRAIDAGQRIGAYRILQEIGRGGMGEVYRAVRADGEFTKEVALKTVRGGYDVASVVERFRNERQILAGLDHPNIARLYDGGTSEDGIPYLVMELVDGIPIDSYCDAEKLNITQRLGLFLNVCSAVQYAHQRLVIHRDIKPGNILVTKEGGPKLLDFGIAKILDPAMTMDVTLVRPMTPEYASPEQIRGEPITTASDVYSLGVVLYQLLTGRSPYRMETRTPQELSQAITEKEPERPSTAILRQIARDSTSTQKTAEQLCNAREGSLSRLQRRLAGDLDNIVLKALRKEPQRRYTSVEQLAEDLRRHLDGLPVSARGDSWSYRAGKFARRHKAGVAASGLVAATLVAGVVVTQREARIAESNRLRAEKRFNDVRKLSNSLIFEIHDSIESLPGATPARKLLLDRAVEYLDKLSADSSGDPNLQRELAWGYQRLATVQGDSTQSNLGQVGAAESSNRKARTLFEAVAKANPKSVTDQINLAMAYRTQALFDVYLPSGRAEISQALAVTDPLITSNGNQVEVKNERAMEYLILAYNQDAVGDRLQSVETFRKVRDLRQEIMRSNPDYPGIRQGLAKVTVLLAHEIGRFGSRDEAMPLMNSGIADYEALAKSTKDDPGVSRELSTSVQRRGDVELIMGDIAAARADFRRSRERLERLAKLDPENKMLQSDVWVAEFLDGRALAAGGKYADALPVLQRAFQGYKALQMENDVGPGPGAMEAWIGEAQAGMHQLPEALESFRKAAATLEADRENFDDARCDLAMVESKIAAMLMKLGRPQEAAAEYAKALETANLTFSLQHSDIPALYAAADAYSGTGEEAALEARATQDGNLRSKLFGEARAAYQKSLDTWKQIPNPSKVSGNGYMATTDPKAIAIRIASLPKAQ